MERSQDQRWVTSAKKELDKAKKDSKDDNDDAIKYLLNKGKRAMEDRLQNDTKQMFDNAKLIIEEENAIFSNLQAQAKIGQFDVETEKT